MIKCFHEAPNSIFEEVQSMTAGDYCLVHLLDENDEYLNHFLNSKKKNREIILDNSIFENGIAYNDESFANWIDTLRPTWYIVPDVLEDGFQTLNNLVNFRLKYEGYLPGKVIAVAQGRTLYEMLYCFEQLHDDSFVDMIALSFDLSFYESIESKQEDRLSSWMRGRQHLILRYIDYHYQSGRFYKPVHLLGTALAREGIAYRDIKWIYSVDTSNPVIGGIYNLKYDGLRGLNEKRSTKVADLIDMEVDGSQFDLIKYNIETFKKIWNK